MRRTAPARARALGLCAAGLLAAACRPAGGLPTERVIPLPGPVAEGATLAADSAGLLWIGTPGRLTAVDSGGAAVAQVQTGGDGVPRVLWRRGSRLVLTDGRRLLAAGAGGGTAAAGWSPAVPPALAADPRGVWVYTANRRGGVLGLDAETLRPAWGWPETGGEALGMAVSPLADRVYVSVAGADDLPAAVQVRDAASGRVLAAMEQRDPVRSLTAGPDGTLYGMADGTVVRLRHVGGELRRVWSHPPAVGGDDEDIELRVDPSGARLAVFGRARGARLVVLDAQTGSVLGQTTAPLDAAFGGEGRLFLLTADGIRLVP